LDWFGIFAKISGDVSDGPMDPETGSQVALLPADRKILLGYLASMYRALSKKSLPFEIAFGLGELCFLQSQFKDALRCGICVPILSKRVDDILDTT
jgi:hypothetical protein